MGGAQPAPQRDLLGSLRTLAITALSVVATRLEILAVELAEERLRLAKILVLGALTAFFTGLFMIFLSLLVVAANWDGHRIAALAGVMLVHALLGAGAGWLLYRQLGRKSRLFTTSLEELHKDRSVLEGGPGDEDEAEDALGATGTRR